MKRWYRRTDFVSAATRQAVVDRDAKAIALSLIERGVPIGNLKGWYGNQPVCVAPMLSPGGLDPCSGDTTLDHVKDEPRMGKRAPSDVRHLVCICAHHHLDGWATSHRPLLRWYLFKINENPGPSATHVTE